MDNERRQRGLAIAATVNLRKQADDSWSVPSQSMNGRYIVRMTDDGPTCSCPDHELTGKTCKHGFAVQYTLFRETRTETTPQGDTRTTVTESATVRVTYSQNWPAYNKAQCAEKELFCHLLSDLCADVPQPEQAMGRPRIPMADALFSACFKVYATTSGRRFMSDLREASANGFIARPWHYNTVLKVIEDASLTPVLMDLVTASAAPLKSVESTFAVDSTGFGTQCFYRHYSAKYGHDQMNRDYVKLHALIGTKTNVIAACTVTDRNGGDSPQFVPLLEDAARTFTMEEVTADKAYSSKTNLEAVVALGAKPFVPFKSNATGGIGDKASRKSKVWTKLFHYYNLQREDFLSHYHQRSNVESAFSSIKRVFGDTLRSKTEAAQTNELLLKVIAYNIVCVVHSIFELGVKVPGISAHTQSALASHNVAAQ